MEEGKNAINSRETALTSYSRREKSVCSKVICKDPAIDRVWTIVA